MVSCPLPPQDGSGRQDLHQTELGSWQTHLRDVTPVAGVPRRAYRTAGEVDASATCASSRRGLAPALTGRETSACAETTRRSGRRAGSIRDDPAHAGTTRACESAAGRTPDDPRVRGDDGKGVNYVVTGWG